MPERVNYNHQIKLSETAVGCGQTFLFLLLFSGPPKFRFRENQSSLLGEIDFAIILQLIAWGIAGLFVLYQLRQMTLGKQKPLRLERTHKIAIVLIVMLSIGTLTSLAPAFTAVKVAQIAVEFLFCTMFVQRYGIGATLKQIYLASCTLCAAIVVAIFLVPDLVLFATETDSLRLRGSGITETNVVSAFGLILFLSLGRRPRFLREACLFLFFVSLLLASLTRAAWVAVGFVLLIALIKQPLIHGMKWIYASGAVAVVSLLFGALTYLAQFRDSEGLWTLSARLGLWQYLTENLMARSPWLGLGYAAGTRVLGVEFNPDLGTGHSIYFDVLIGGGIISLLIFLYLIGSLASLTFKCVRLNRSRESFAVCSLFVFVFIFGMVGAEIDTSPFGFTFWCLVSILPVLYKKVLAVRPVVAAEHGLLHSTYLHGRKPNAIS